MADNTRLNAGSGGDLIATDDIAGVKYQVVKLAVGADGSVALLTEAPLTDTALRATPVPVSGTVTVTGIATEASLADVVTAAEAIQTAVEGTVDVSITDAVFAPTVAKSTAFGNSLQVKASAGTLFGFTVHNKSAATLWVGLYDAASKTGTVLQYFPVYANDTTAVEFGPYGLPCSTGIFLQALSDHDGTNTSDSGSSLWFCGRYT